MTIEVVVLEQEAAIYAEALSRALPGVQVHAAKTEAEACLDARTRA